MIAVGRGTNADLDAAGAAQIITGIDVTDTASVEKMAAAIDGEVDMVINNAGYFYEPREELDSLNFGEELKARTPMHAAWRCVHSDGQPRVTDDRHLRARPATRHIGAAQRGQAETRFEGDARRDFPCRMILWRKVSPVRARSSPAQAVIITSQAGSAEWRFTQNADAGGDYGHHMSRAACNIMGVLLSQELKAAGVTVVLLHPGFNRTEMTAKYKEIWDIEGAVEPSIGAKRVLHEALGATLEKTGAFVNCEDGLRIPW